MFMEFAILLHPDVRRTAVYVKYTYLAQKDVFSHIYMRKWRFIERETDARDILIE